MNSSLFVLRPDLDGANLVGYFRAESGVGEHARTLAASLDAAGIPYARRTFMRTLSRQAHALDHEDSPFLLYDLNLLFVNADETPRLFSEHPDIREGRYSIGYWAWEVEEFPDEMAASAALVDEIWANSRHSAAAIARKVPDRPVLAMPPAVDPPVPEPLPASWSLPPSPRILVAFDYDSVFDRKNPLGAIAAFRSAFPEPGPARLLIKSVNGERHPELGSRLAAAVEGRSDITLLDGYLTRGQQAGLISACDVYLSLHRAEGFGLMLAEAMLAGKPVVATGYSGNLDFMDDQTALLVPWTRVAIQQGAGPYGGTWAEPDVAAAASALRHVLSHADVAAALGRRARAAILEGHTPEARSHQVAARLAAIRMARGLTLQPNLEPSESTSATLARSPRCLEEGIRTKLERLAIGVEQGPARLIRQESRWRRAMLRLLSPIWQHQREVDRALLEILSLELSSSRADAAVSRSEALHARLIAQGALRQSVRWRDWKSRTASLESRPLAPTDESTRQGSQGHEASH